MSQEATGQDGSGQVRSTPPAEHISLNGDSSFRADGGSIENYGHIDLGVFNLDLTANSFTNHADATIDAATVNLDVASYINDGTVDAVVVSDTTIDQ